MLRQIGPGIGSRCAAPRSRRGIDRRASDRGPVLLDALPVFQRSRAGLPQIGQTVRRCGAYLLRVLFPLALFVAFGACCISCFACRASIKPSTRF